MRFAPCAVCLAAFWPGLTQNFQQGESRILKWAGSLTPTITKAANATWASFRAMRLPASSASAASGSIAGACPDKLTCQLRRFEWTPPVPHAKPGQGWFEGKLQLLHRGIEYSVMRVEPGIWKWTFRIGGDVTTGKTATNIDLLAARRVQLRINRALTERDRLGL
jgi:hypothetical protein